MTIRKNFVCNDEVAAHLEELAKEEGRSQTALVQALIEKRYLLDANIFIFVASSSLAMPRSLQVAL